MSEVSFKSPLIVMAPINGVKWREAAESQREDEYETARRGTRTRPRRPGASGSKAVKKVHESGGKKKKEH